MKVSREQMAANRARILGVASELFRERGFENVGVAEIMQAAGMTHGAFYGHFASKEALAAEAAAHALEQAREHWKDKLEAAGEQGLREYIETYLSPKHRDAPAQGCAIVALGAEVARQEASVRDAFAREVMLQIDTLAACMSGKNAEQKREKAMALVAQMAGAVLIARILGRKGVSDQMLAAVRHSLDIAGTAD